MIHVAVCVLELGKRPLSTIKVLLTLYGPSERLESFWGSLFETVQNRLLLITLLTSINARIMVTLGPVRKADKRPYMCKLCLPIE